MLGASSSRFRRAAPVFDGGASKLNPPFFNRLGDEASQQNQVIDLMQRVRGRQRRNHESSRPSFWIAEGLATPVRLFPPSAFCREFRNGSTRDLRGESARPQRESGEDLGLQQVGEADPVKHLSAQAVEHGEADIGAVLGRIVVNPERALAEG